MSNHGYDNIDKQIPISQIQMDKIINKISDFMSYRGTQFTIDELDDLVPYLIRLNKKYDTQIFKDKGAEFPEDKIVHDWSLQLLQDLKNHLPSASTTLRHLIVQATVKMMPIDPLIKKINIPLVMAYMQDMFGSDISDDIYDDQHIQWFEPKFRA